MTDLEEAVIWAAKRYTAAVDGRVVRQSQDNLYRAVKALQEFEEREGK
jgi:hypothetical protein